MDPSASYLSPPPSKSPFSPIINKNQIHQSLNEASISVIEGNASHDTGRQSREIHDEAVAALEAVDDQTTTKNMTSFNFGLINNSGDDLAAQAPAAAPLKQ